MLKNLMVATLYVRDQDRALAFYTDRLGLEKGADHRLFSPIRGCLEGLM